MTETKESLLTTNQELRIKKEKEDSDDTTSFEGDNTHIDDFMASNKKARRSRRRSYKSFKLENKSFWMWFNLCIALFSTGFLVGTYLIIDANSD